MTFTFKKKNAFSTLLVGSSLILHSCQLADASPLGPPKLEIPHGHNDSAGRVIDVDGIKVYFETYGEGQPMLLIHGNGQDISAMGYQLKFFSNKYNVIAADSRGQGKSEMGSGRLTYEQMAEDANALLEKLGLKHVYVLGWSDGGIIGLELAMKHPDKVAKLAIMGANLNPHGAYDWAYNWSTKQEKQAETMIAKGDKSQPWPIYKQYFDLLAKQPNIPVEKLAAVAAPDAGDGWG